MAEIDKTEVASRKEIPIAINLRGLWKGYDKVFCDAATNVFKWAARKIEPGTKHMMTGFASALAMPPGSMGRNGASVANDSGKGEFRHHAQAVGTVGSGATWWLAGKGASARFATSLAITGTAGKVGAAVLAATVASPVMNRGASKKQFPVTSVPRSVAARGSVIFSFTF